MEWIESQTSVPPTSLGPWAWKRQAAMPWEGTGAAAIRKCKEGMCKKEDLGIGLGALGILDIPVKDFGSEWAGS